MSERRLTLALILAAFITLILFAIIVQVEKSSSSNNAHPLRLSFNNEDLIHAKVALGSPSQEFNFLVDTGASISWVTSHNFEGLCKRSLKGFDNSRSRTYKALGKKFQGSIPSFNFSGPLAKDTFDFNAFKVENQVFAEIEDFPGTFMCWRKFAGSLGLGLSAKGEPNSLVENMIEQSLIPEPIVFLNMNLRSTPEEESDGGYVIFGGIEADKVGGEVDYFSSTSDTRWQLEMKDLRVESDSGVRVCQRGCSASIESGILSIFGPINETRKINEAIGAEESVYQNVSTWTVSCDKKNKPNVALEIGGKTFIIEPKDYIIDLRSRGTQTCYSLFSSRKLYDREADWILGAKFLQKYYTIFDYAKKWIGFVAKK